MTTGKGGGPHPGDPWHPDWESAVPGEESEEDWPYDESLTLSDAELEVADLDEAEEPEQEQVEVSEEEAVEVAEVEEEVAEVEPVEVAETEEEVAEVEEEAAEVEPVEVAEVDEEVAETEVEPVEVAETEEEVAEEEPVEVAEVEPVEVAEAEVEAEVAEEEAVEVAEVEEEEEVAEVEPVEVAEVEEEVAEEEPIELIAIDLEPEVAETAEPVELAVVEESSEGDEVLELAVSEADAGVSEGSAEVVVEFEVEELEAEPERMEAIDEISLEDAIDDESDVATEPSFKELVLDEVDVDDIVVEEEVFEVVDLDDADLRGDTAENFFDVFDFEEPVETVADESKEPVGEALEVEEIDHDEVTAEVPAMPAAADDAEVALVTLDETDEAAFFDDLLAEIDFEVPADFEELSSSVDEHRDALAAFMRPGSEPRVDDGVSEPELVTDGGDGSLVFQPPEPAEGEQLETVPDLEPEPLASKLSVVPVGLPMEDQGPKTPEQEIVAELSDDLGVVDFEAFVSSDFETRDYLQSPTQEHIGLAEAVSEAGDAEQSALAAALPGLDHGHLGFDEFEEDLEFHDPEASEREEADDMPAEPTPTFEPDLTLRMASAVILVSLLVGALFAGGVVFLLFIIVVAVASQIEFYAALRNGGYRPMVLFGLLGGLGALIGTFVQGNDVFTEGPVAVPAALGLTVVATFAWYGSQENPPHEPWRNGVATVFGVAWIPALLAFVIPMNEASRSIRFQLIFVLLVMVAAFDVGSYFVGRAIGSRKLAPVVSPNKTVEGLIGGIVATVIVALISAALVNAFDAGSALALAAAVILVAPLGDLAESVIKRSLNLKDMGQLLPGHGGVLDRIDSYLFVLPVAYLVLRWTNLL
ncbi:MAG: phosphatidate cytidylyltransferase [Acidimicrobiia bacterium]